MTGPGGDMTGLDQPPPFWGRWSRLYWLVGGLLAVDMLVFWLLTRWAS
jgi:hypothetical protein